MWNDEHWICWLCRRSWKSLFVFGWFWFICRIVVHILPEFLPLIWNKERLLYLQGTSPYPTYGKGTSSGPSYLKNPGDVGSQEDIFPATLKALGQLLTPPYHLDIQATSRDLAPTSAGPAASIGSAHDGSIWLVYYLRTHLPSKSTIHVGKCTIVPWIL